MPESPYASLTIIAGSNTKTYTVGLDSVTEITESNKQIGNEIINTFLIWKNETDLIAEITQNCPFIVTYF